MNDIQKKIIRESEKFSMTGRIRMSLLLKIIDHINSHNIEGDIVEWCLERWKSYLCSKIFKLPESRKKSNWIDTFEGMTEGTELDVQIKQVKIKDKNDTKYIEENRIASKMMKSIDKHKNDGKIFGLIVVLKMYKKI